MSDDVIRVFNINRSLSFGECFFCDNKYVEPRVTFTHIVSDELSFKMTSSDFLWFMKDFPVVEIMDEI